MSKIFNNELNDDACHELVLRARQAGRDWAEREMEMYLRHPGNTIETARAAGWLPTTDDARPLVSLGEGEALDERLSDLRAELDDDLVDADELESELAEIANDEAAERWCALCADEEALTVPAVELADNGEQGDKRVRLIVAPCDGGGRDVYLETNAGPMLVQQDETASACSIEQAAEALGMSPREVYDLVISAFPECDWSEPES